MSVVDYVLDERKSSFIKLAYTFYRIALILINGFMKMSFFNWVLVHSKSFLHAIRLSTGESYEYFYNDEPTF